MVWILRRNPISSDKKSGVFIWEMKQNYKFFFEF